MLQKAAKMTLRGCFFASMRSAKEHVLLQANSKKRIFLYTIYLLLSSINNGFIVCFFSSLHWKNPRFSAIMRRFLIFFHVFMQAQQTTHDSLREEVHSLLEDSPTLERYPDQKQVFLRLLPQLNEEQLDALKSQLEAESEDWEAFLDDTQKQQESLMEQMQQESLQILKSAEKQLLDSEHQFSEADQSSAEQLLDQFDA